MQPVLPRRSATGPVVVALLLLGLCLITHGAWPRLAGLSGVRTTTASLSPS